MHLRRASATGPAVASYQKNLARSAFDLPKSIFEKAEKKSQDDYERILKQNQDKKDAENPYLLHQELGDACSATCTIERDNNTIDKVLAKIDEIDERVKNVEASTDLRPAGSTRARSSSATCRTWWSWRASSRRARATATSRAARTSSRSSRSATTRMAAHHARRARGRGRQRPIKYVRDFDYELAGKPIHITDAVDTSLVAPRERKYEQAGAASAAATGELSNAEQQKSA